jgi:hypothetical protein
VAHAANIPDRKVSQGSYSAFVPASLPPELNFSPRRKPLLARPILVEADVVGVQVGQDLPAEF